MSSRPPLNAPETLPPPPSTPLHLKCSPFQRIVAPGCHRGSSLWAGQSEAHLKVGAKKKIPASASRVKYLRKEEKKNTQCSVSSCIQVTPSINSEINLDVAYKEPLQRKGGRREKVGFSLLLLVTPVEALIGKCCVLLCNNLFQSVWMAPVQPHTRVTGSRSSSHPDGRLSEVGKVKYAYQLLQRYASAGHTWWWAPPVINLMEPETVFKPITKHGWFIHLLIEPTVVIITSSARCERVGVRRRMAHWTLVCLSRQHVF